MTERAMFMTVLSIESILHFTFFIMNYLRKPFFFSAVALAALIVLIESGSPWLLTNEPNTQFLENIKTELPEGSNLKVGKEVSGLAVPALALLDGLILLTVVLMWMPLLITDRIHAKVQGVVTLFVSVSVLFIAIKTIYNAITSLTVMITLLTTPIFGTIGYLVVYGSFERGSAAIALISLMILKIGFAISLVLAHQQFLQNKGLVLIVFSSLLATIVVSFLQGFPPLRLVSITDAIAAIVVAISSVVWTLLFLRDSIKSLYGTYFKTVKMTK
jgi:hypothetical protein